MYSKLVDKYIPSPFYGDRNAQIDTVTIHHMGGDFTIETCGNIFQRKNKNASSNYGIGSDGRIACYVDEENRAKTSSNWRNDARAITIEVADDDVTKWTVSNKAMDSLIKLLCDVCTRYKILPLKWDSNKDRRISHVDGANMTIHRDFSKTICPGEYLISKMNWIAEEVNRRCLQGSPDNEKPEPSTFLVRVTAKVLNVRNGAGTEYKINRTVRKGEVFTIIETRKVGTILWGKLKSGAGWICLTYTEPVTFR